MNVLRDAWRGIHGTELPPRDRVNLLPAPDQLLYHLLVVEATQPVRVVLGFEGYRSEHALRRGLVDVLTTDSQVQGISPLTLPNLVMARDSSLIKLNGMPYIGPYDSARGAWYFYGSRGVNSMQSLLELLWTRLNYYFGAPASIFGEDLDLDCINALLVGKPVSHENRQRWRVEIVDLSDEDLSRTPGIERWMPAVLSDEAFVIMNLLCEGNEVSLDDKDLQRFIENGGRTLEDLVSELRNTRLVYVDEHCRLCLLTDSCVCMVVPGVGYVAAENKSGRLERWLFQQMTKLRSQQK